MPDPTKPAASPLPPPRSEHVHAIEMLLSHLLRTGVIASSAVVLLGTVLTFIHHRDYFSSAVPVATVMRDMAFPHTLSAVLTGLKEGQGRAVIILGLFLLIATPVTRVALSILIFLHERDRPFAIITSIVLILLLISFFLGHAG